MRVVGGKCKGRRLASFKGASIRPTSDKVREAVFNILPQDFPFRKVLDLFAGTGAMGIEALSRGAEDAVFVDKGREAAGLIKNNLEACSLDARVFTRDVLSSISILARKGERFDLVFIDPPYDTALVEETLKLIDSTGLLSPGGVIVAESSRRVPVKTEYETIGAFDERRYGDTVVYFLGFREKADA